MLYATLFAGFVWQSAAFEDFEIDVEDHIHLLQVQAKKNNRTAMDLPVNHHYVFDNCASFGGAADIVGTGRFNPQSEDNNFDYCRCWGDTHCNAVPFDADTSSVSGAGHYQYDGPGASRFAKAADGSWEIQIFQCGNQPTFHPSGQVGVAIKAGGIVVEVGTANRHTVQCYVNGQLKPPGYEVHLPTGFHFRCPAASRVVNARGRPVGPSTPAYGTFCAVKDGQFVASSNHWEWGTQINQVLAVPKNVDVQEANTICYDSSSKSGQQLPQGGKEVSTTAIVSAEEVIFSQKLLDYMSSSPLCNLQTPRQSAVPAGEPVDPQVICNEKSPSAWQHAQDVCSPLQEQHLAFYNDCLVDECVRADDSEEAEIEEIAEADEPVDDEASAQGDPHITRSGGGKFDLDSSMLKHRH